MRNVLVTALLARSDSSLKPKARRFLQGLSADELQFIAEYLGACILESTGPCRGCSAQPMAEFRYCPNSPDQEHKLILLLEYLRRSELPAAARA